MSQDQTSSQSKGIPAIRVLMMPRETNANGSIFGGVLLSYIDQAGAVEARESVPGRFVTVAMNAVEFHVPVFVGDVVSFYTETLRVGRTSVKVRVRAEADRFRSGNHIVVTEAEVTYVAIDEEGNPVPVASSKKADEAS